MAYSLLSDTSRTTLFATTTIATHHDSNSFSTNDTNTLVGGSLNYRSMTCDCTQSSGNNSATTTSATNYIATVAGTASVHPARSSGSNGSPGITTPMMMASSSSSSSSSSSGTTNGGCPCAVINTVAGSGGSIVAAAAAAGGSLIGGNGATGIGAGTAAGVGININVNAAYGDDATTSNAETLLSSNAKFQAISAIAVTQDGVINVADQGKNKLLSICSTSK